MISTLFHWCYTIATIAVMLIGTAAILLIGIAIWWYLLNKIAEWLRFHRDFSQFIWQKYHSRPKGNRMSDEEAAVLKRESRR